MCSVFHSCDLVLSEATSERCFIIYLFCNDFALQIVHVQMLILPESSHVLKLAMKGQNLRVCNPDQKGLMGLLCCVRKPLGKAWKEGAGPRR